MAKHAGTASEGAISRWRRMADSERKRPNLRRSERFKTYLFARLVVEGNVQIDCVVRDLSDGGARVRLEADYDLPKNVRLNIVETGKTRTARVAWQRARHAGLEFWTAKARSYGPARD